jgi:hypothetical protein
MMYSRMQRYGASKPSGICILYPLFNVSLVTLIS